MSKVKKVRAEKPKKKKRFHITGSMIMNIAVFVMVAIVLFMNRDGIIESWDILSKPNPMLLILILLIPVQILSYFARGMIFWSYLKDRGKLKGHKISEAFRVALEINFLDTAFPSGGVSGIAYTVWRMGKIGVNKSLTLTTQLMRGVFTLIAYISLFAISLIIMTIQGHGDITMIIFTVFVILALVLGVFLLSFILGNKKRVIGLTNWCIDIANKIVKKISFGRIKKDVIPKNKAAKFMIDMHKDYVVLTSEKKLLIKPLFWAFVHILSDVALFVTAFLAVGVEFNIVALVVSYGAASGLANVVFTPGGFGAFEPTMAGMMAGFGSPYAGAWSAVILARVILVLGTIGSGYIVYLQAMKKYGKPPQSKK